MANSPDADLVIDTLVIALERRQSDERLDHHSDRGAVSTSLAFGIRAAELGITQSIESTGDCHDNAAVDAVWATLKRELARIDGRQTWPTRDLLHTSPISMP
jgi:putative transposase